MDQPRTLNSLTVVAPFFNEEAMVMAFFEQVTAALDRLPVAYDLVFVDDGSRDQTLALLNRLADGASNISVLSLARNMGHQAALTAGLDHAEGDAVIVMDSDLQHPPHVIPAMVAEYEAGADVVYAVRENAEDLGWLKRITAQGYYALLRRFTRIEVIQGAADFRLMARPVVLALREMRETHRYLRGMVPWLGFTRAVVHYHQPDRFAGQPAYTWRKSMQLARHGLFSFSTIPLDLITWLGILMIVLALVYFIYTVAIALSGVAIAGWASMIIVMLVLGGVQLISIGVIAQYIGMIFEEVKHRPLYVLKQKRLVTTPKQDTQAP